MRFSTLHIDGFGRLSNVPFRLSTGLNVFFGPNEAGKSTLQQAIWALLYGFYKEDRRNPQETAQLKHFRPWRGGAYSGNLVYQLDSGQAYQIFRNFDEEDLRTSVHEADTGRDVTRDFECGKLGRVSFALEHFGMPEKVFVNTCFVRQSDLHQLEEVAGAISDTIVNLSATGSQNRSIQKALGSLNEAFREQVGEERARTKPLRVAKVKLEVLENERSQIRSRRDDLEEAYKERAQLISEQEKRRQEVTRFRYLLAVRHRDLLGERIGKIDRLQTKKDELKDSLDRLKEFADFPLHLHPLVSRLHQKWQGAQEKVEKASDELRSAALEGAELRRRRQELLEEQRPIGVAHDISCADLLKIGPQALHDLGLRWEAAEQEMEVAAAEVEAADKIWQGQPLAVEDYERLHDLLSGFRVETLLELKERSARLEELQEVAGSGLKPATVRALLIAGVLTAVGGLAGLLLSLTSGTQAFLVAGIVALVLGLGAAFAVQARLRRSARLRLQAQEYESHLTADVEKYSFSSVRELEASYNNYHKAQIPYEHLSQARKTLMGKRATIESVQNETRLLLGLEPEPQLTPAILKQAELCAEEISDQISDLNGREQQNADLSLKLEEKVKYAAIAEEEAQKALRDVLLQAGVDESDLEEGIADFEARYEKAHTVGKLRNELDAIERQIQAHQGGRSVDQLRQEYEYWSREAMMLLGANPNYKGLSTDEQPNSLQQQLDIARMELARIEKELALIEKFIEEAMTGTRPLAEVEEEIEGQKSIIVALELHGSALKFASEQLHQANDEHNRNFLPQLNRVVSESLSRMTAGRYSAVQIDHADLQLRLQVPERPDSVTPEVLSRGTQEQIYLLLRLGLTELMSSGRERLPLVLDDPMVNYDHDRHLRGLELLADISSQTQILLFTKDEETVRWFESNHASAAAHKLHRL